MVWLVVLWTISEDLDVILISNQHSSFGEFKGLAEALNPLLAEAHIFKAKLGARLKEGRHWTT